MINLVSYKNWFFAISAIPLIVGIISLAAFRLNFGIDFLGGSLWEIKFNHSTQSQQIREVFQKEGIEISSIQSTQDNAFLIRTKVVDDKKQAGIEEKIASELGQFEKLRFESVGPTISKELSQNAFKALGFAILAIVIYITWAFRTVPKEYSSLRFGVCAIIALIHDVLIVVGIFSLLGHFFKVEIDLLFITALLTVIGFSVHDTIVVFDRIRENAIKHPGQVFTQVVNDSLLQTLGRSVTTSLTVVFVLTALLLFGGVTIRWFVVALLIGIISGTYSSIFNASMILVVWNEQIARGKNS